MRIQGGGQRGEARAAWPVLLVTAVALGLRFYRLDFQSMWWDEGISLYLAGQGLNALVFAKDFSLDLHPPLYHILLAAWTAVVGPDVFSARALSALLGAANVPLLWLLVRRLAGETAAVVAAGLLAVSPLHVFYSQEARMYSLVPLLATLSLLAFVWLLAARDRRARLTAAVAYAVFTATGLWAYYYLGLLVMAQLVYLSVRWLQNREDIRWPSLALTGSGVLFLPWALVFLNMLLTTDYWQVNEGAHSAPEIIGFLRTFGLAFSVGFSVVEPWSLWLAATFLGLGLVGLAGGGRRQWHGRGLMLLWLMVPLLLAYFIATQRTFVFPRFVLFSALAVYGLVGAGVAWFWERQRAVALAFSLVLLGSAAFGLSRHYAEPRTAYASSDYRPLLAEIAPLVRPTDLVISEHAWGAGYARGYLSPPPSLLWAQPAWARDDATASGELAELVAKHGRVWVLTWLPEERWEGNRLETQLARVAQSRFVDQVGEFRLRLFNTAAEHATVEVIAGRQDRLGDLARLTGFSRRAPSALVPGSRVEVDLSWRSLDRFDRDYAVFVQLVGPDGRLYGQDDGVPVAGTHPTRGWTPGETVIDRHTFTLAQGAPAGEYRLIAGMYDPVTGKRLPAEEGDFLLLETLYVVAE